MRTQEDIAEKCSRQNDMLGFTTEVLFPYLDYDHAKPLLREDVTEADWERRGFPRELTPEAVKKEMGEYMKFAWGKVEDHRGISANRSVIKMEAWLWLLGDDQTLKEVGDAGYTNYGAPKLAVVCRRYGFPIPGGAWITNMIDGRPCQPDCYEGCWKDSDVW